MNLPASVEIVEVGPRDGLQSEETNVPTPEKISLLETLAAAGIKRFEATSFASPKSIPQLADAEDMLAGLTPEDGVVYGALIPNERGYERARAAVVEEVVLVGCTTDGYCQSNLKRSVDEVLEGFAPIADRGREDGIRVRANRFDHFRRSVRWPARPRANTPRRVQGGRERHRRHHPLGHHRDRQSPPGL